MNTKIKIKAKNVIELLKLLEKSDETLCTLDLDLEVSKSIIKILDNYSEDWDFYNEQVQRLKVIQDFAIGEQKEVHVELENKDSCICCMEKDKELDPLEYYTKKLGINNYNSLATLVESIFKINKNSPNITFESGLFFNVLEVEYNNRANSEISIEHSLLAMIIESYYKDSKIEDALEDTISKLKGMWISKELSGHPNTTSLTKILYGPKIK